MSNNSCVFAERLVQIIGSDSTNSFARKCGINEGSLRGYLKGAAPRLDNLVAIADAAGVNIAWLATGEGPMMRGQAAPAAEQVQEPHQQYESAGQSPNAAFDALGVVEGMGMLTTIYSSGDTTYIRAINANLMAFSDATRMKNTNKDMQNQINTLENQLSEMENRMAALEKKLEQRQEVQKKVVNGS